MSAPAEIVVEHTPAVAPPRRRRRLWIAAGLALVVAAGAGAVALRGRGAPAPAWQTVAVERGRVVSRVTATGTLSALVTVQVGSQVSGRVSELFADFNSPVKKGQRIAKIDPQLFQAALEQARANTLAAQADLARAKVQAADAVRQFERVKDLGDRGLVAQAERDTAQATAEAAQASVDSAAAKVAQTRAALHQAEVNLAYTDILSPINGTVISRSVDVGQTVAASLQAPTVFVIAEDLRKMQVDTSVAEADVGRLRPGMDATFTVDAFPGKRFVGHVRQIRNAPQTVQNVVTYDAVIDVDNPELELRPGMTANVTFVVAERDGVLRVPNAALRFRPPAGAGGDAAAGGRGPRGGVNAAGGSGAPAARRESEPDRRTVWVLRPGATAPDAVRIRTGVSDGSVTEVVEGELREGDAVVTDAVGAGAGAGAAARPGGAASGGPRGGGMRLF